MQRATARERRLWLIGLGVVELLQQVHGDKRRDGAVDEDQAGDVVHRDIVLVRRVWQAAGEREVERYQRQHAGNAQAHPGRWHRDIDEEGAQPTEGDQGQREEDQDPVVPYTAGQSQEWIKK